MERQGFLFFGASDAQAELVARFLLACPSFGTTRGIRTVPAQDLVADFELAFFGRGAWLDAGYKPRAVGFALEGKAESSPDAFGFAQFETGAGKKLLIRQWRGSADVLRKKVLERAVNEFFGREADIEAVAVILARFRKILIHGAHEVVETALMVG